MRQRGAPERALSGRCGSGSFLSLQHRVTRCLPTRCVRYCARYDTRGGMRPGMAAEYETTESRLAAVLCLRLCPLLRRGLTLRKALKERNRLTCLTSLLRSCQHDRVRNALCPRKAAGETLLCKSPTVRLFSFPIFGYGILPPCVPNTHRRSKEVILWH